ncbi:MAG: exopolyphosphatase [Bacteroidia bacterium]|nr:MAG: exopolyphosphatase [Bacteroidia bacterium]
MNKTSDKKQLSLIIKNSNHICILSHHNPDADAVGSSLALYFLLKKMKKNVHIILPNAFPEFLNWMPASNKIIIYENNKQSADKLINKAQLLFLLDCNSFKRLGTDGLAETSAHSQAKKILIDHHKFPEKYFDAFYFDDTASSTCELIYKFSEHLNILNLLDKKIAQCLYTGLMTDTGSFKYDSVTAQTMRIAAHLMEFKINHTKIQQNVFDTYSYDRLKLVGYALSEKLVYLSKFKTAYIALSQEELKRFNYKKGDTEGLVNTALSIKDVKLSALITETDKMIRISLRSKGDVDVNEIARKYFNGGGHKNAAGGQMNTSLNEVVEQFESVVKSLNL